MAEKEKILIVDDDENIAELISLYLTRECFECRIANDGETALKDAKSFQPDLILLDLMLPGMDGYEVCREIRHKSNVPIIILSAKGEVFDKVLGLEMGFSGDQPGEARRGRASAEICGIPGSHCQPHQLFGGLPRPVDRYAAQGD